MAEKNPAPRRRRRKASSKKAPKDEAVPKDEEEIQVQYVPIDVIDRWPRNPKLHDHSKIEASIKRFGYVLPMVKDTTMGRLVAGHGRLETLLRMKERGEPVPKRIKVDEQGRWCVPVIAGVEFGNETEAEAYLLADNRIVELGGWSEGDLARMIRDQAALGDNSVYDLGWDEGEVGELLGTIETLEKVNDPRDTEWVGMPEFTPQEFQPRITFIFKSEEERQQFSDSLKLRFSKKQKSMWSVRWPLDPEVGPGDRHREDLVAVTFDDV